MTDTRDMPAFPIAFQEHDASGMTLAEMYAHDGMTLRDYFAAKAMQGLLASWDSHSVEDFCELAEDAYSVADVMIAKRER